LKDAAGDVGEDVGGEILFANLDDLDALIDPAGGLLDDGFEALFVVAGKDVAVSDGAA